MCAKISQPGGIRLSLPVIVFIPMLIVFLGIQIPVLSQVFSPRKDLVFTQVIASPGFESVISVTNRGSEMWTGYINYYTGENGTVWNPLVNTQRVTEGKTRVILLPHQTRAYSISDTDFLVGYAFIESDNYNPTNHLEGNLTYYSRDSGITLDAVGVPPSSEFLAATLPFYAFNDVGLSLAVPELGDGGDAEVTILLYNDSGNQITQCTVDMLYGAHYAKYLKEMPWEGSLDQMGNVGKVEIFGDRYLSGIAMTVTPDNAGGAQISTLPLEGTPLLYTFSGVDTEEVEFEGNISFWFDGFFVNGYMQVTSLDGLTIANPDTWRVTGQLDGLDLELTFPCYLGDKAAVPKVSLYVSVPGYTTTNNDVSGTFSADEITLVSVPTRGTIDFVKVVPGS